MRSTTEQSKVPETNGKSNTGKLLMFHDPAPRVRPVKRDGYGRPITHMFGLRISDTVCLSRPYEFRRSGGVVELFQAKARA